MTTDAQADAFAERAEKARSPWGEIALVLALLLGAFLARWIAAARGSYWHDEAYSISTAALPLRRLLVASQSDFHPPLYYMLLAAMMRLGEAIGGPLATLTWLRMSAIVPGVATSALGWMMARQHWGPSSALAVLALLAFSPALGDVSLDLRGYSLAIFLLMAATLFLLRAVAPQGGLRDAIAYAACAVAALHTHNLAALYVAAHCAILLLECARPGAPRKALALRGALAAGLVLVVCAPWLRHALAQNSRLMDLRLGWIPRARWRDLEATYFLYVNCGPMTAIELIKAGRDDLAQAAFRVFFGAAAIWFLAGRLIARRRGAPAPTDDASEPDRLWLACAVLAVLPIFFAFAASRLGLAQAFLPVRYNLLAAPYALIAAIGLLRRIEPQSARAIAHVLLLGATAQAFATGMMAREDIRDDLGVFGGRFDPRDAAFVGEPVCLTAPSLLPWLGDYHGLRLQTIDETLSASRPSSHVWVLAHIAGAPNHLWQADAAEAIELLLDRGGPGIEKYWQQRPMWIGAWRVERERLAEIKREADEIVARAETLRRGREDGTLLLPYERTYPLPSKGWAPAEANAQGEIFSWGLGEEQRLRWFGPAKPGEFELAVYLRRPYPLPEPTIKIEWHTEGQGPPHSIQAPEGEVVLRQRIRLTRRSEPISVRIESPSWSPAESLPGSGDQRRLGMQWYRVELNRVSP